MTHCRAILFIGDDYGDNRATFRCQWSADHDGMHGCEFDRGSGWVEVAWQTDEGYPALVDAWLTFFFWLFEWEFWTALDSINQIRELTKLMEGK